MQAKAAVSRSLLRSLWRRARALEHKVNDASQDLTQFASMKIKDSEFINLANQTCPRTTLARVFFRGLLQPICAVPHPAASQRCSDLSHDVRIQRRISKVEGGSEGCAHEVTRLLGERLFTWKQEADSSGRDLQDVGFSLMREMHARANVISAIQAKLLEQSLAHARLNEADFLSKMAPDEDDGQQRKLGQHAQLGQVTSLIV